MNRFCHFGDQARKLLPHILQKDLWRWLFVFSPVSSLVNGYAQNAR